MVPVGGEKVHIVGLRYAQLEAALAKVLGVFEENMPQFRARLRHIKSLLPIGETGKGTHAEYSFENALTFLVALQLNLQGVLPTWAAAYAQWLITHQDLPLEDKSNKDVFFVFKSSNNPAFDMTQDIQTQAALCIGRDDLTQTVENVPMYIVVNVSERARSLLATIRGR